MLYVTFGPPYIYEILFIWSVKVILNFRTFTTLILVVQISSTHPAAHLLPKKLSRMKWPPHFAPLNQNTSRWGLFAMFHYAAENSGKYKTIFSLGWYGVRKCCVSLDKIGNTLTCMWLWELVRSNMELLSRCSPPGVRVKPGGKTSVHISWV